MDAPKTILMVLGLLAGIVLTGAGMVLRGDWLGKDAATTVERNITERIDRIEERSHEAYDHILEQLKEIRMKLDKD